MAAGPFTYIGSNLGAKAVREVIAFEKKTRAYRNAAVSVAEQRGREAIKTAGRIGKQQIERAKVLASSTVNRAKMSGNRAVGAARRVMAEKMAPVNGEFISAKRVYEGSKKLFTRRLQSEVAKFPFVNPMNGGVPFTADQAANAAAGGRWARPWKVAADYRASHLKPALKSLYDRLRPAVDRAANRLMGAENARMFTNRHYGQELSRVVAERSVNIAGAEAQAAAIRKVAAEGAMRRSSAVSRAAQKAVAEAGRVSGIRSAAIATGDVVRGVSSKFVSAGSKIAGFNARYNPINVTGVLRKVGTTLMDSNLSPVKWTAKAGAKAMSVPGRISGAMLSNNPSGRFITRKIAGTAKSNAIGFAAGTWIDAGLNAYDYFTDPNNKVGPGDVTVNGKTSALHKPGIIDAVASKRYAAEVAKGFGRALTLGFWGSGDDTFLDKWAEGNRSADEKRLKEFIDSGRDPYTGKTLTDSDGKPIVTDPSRNERIIGQAKASAAIDSEFRTAGSRSFTEAGFRDYLGKLVAARGSRLQAVEDNVANWTNFSKTLRGPGMTAEQYRKKATANLEKRYDGYISAALSNPMARVVADSNRSQAYRLYTGRDYDKDYALDGSKSGSVEGFKEFNDNWNALTDVQRASWNYEVEKRAYDSAVAAPVDEEDK